jgi:hypothetical protein
MPQFGYSIPDVEAEKQKADQAAAERAAIPEGEYIFAITGAKLITKARTDGSGLSTEMFALDIEVQEGPFAQRKLSRMIGINHPSDQFVQMGREFIAKVAFAVGHRGGINDLAVIMNRPFAARVTNKLQTDKANAPVYDTNGVQRRQNDITSIKAVPTTGAVPPAPQKPVYGHQAAAASPAQPANPTPAAASSAPPAALNPAATPPWLQGKQ